MRSPIAAVLFVVIVAGCSGSGQTGGAPTATHTAAASPLDPPFLPTTAALGSVVRFTCPKRPVSTIDIQSCSGRRVLVLNARLNRQIEIIWARLGDATGRRHFAAGEMAWDAYVKNQCVGRSRAWIDPASPHAYVGGTAARVSYAQCQEDLTATHLRELTETAAALAPI